MDQLNALTNILEYNLQFSKFILHNCPCYKIEYGNFSKMCIENKSYLACIIVMKNSSFKILHLKLPIMFGSMIDFTIRGAAMNNYNQFGCLYLDGSVKLIYNFISNNLSHGHVYTNKKKNEEVFKVGIKDADFSLHMTYNPNSEEVFNINIRDEQYERMKNLEKNITEAKKNIKHDEQYDIKKPKKKKQKTKHQKTYDKLSEIYSKLDIDNIQDRSDSISWIDLVNRKARAQMINANLENVAMDFSTDDYISLYDACLKYAPKLDDLGNKINRTCTYILHRGLLYNIDICSQTDNELKNLNPKLTNMFKNGNMYFTLAQHISLDSGKLVKGFKSIYQNIEAQKLTLAASLVSTIKRSVNDSIKNSKALMYPRDGFHYTCPIDSREMKGAGENVMLSQLVIIPIGIPESEILNHINTHSKELSEESDDDILLQCVINSFLQNLYIAKSKLLNLKHSFPTLSMMIFEKYLIINTTGYNQMKYSIKYKCFMNTFESMHIWPDAFENYHPHLIYNNCALHLPETIEQGLPAKITVANANVRGRCASINSITELILFLHTNGASNAAIIHRKKDKDKLAMVSFDGTKSDHEHTIIIPIELKNPQMRYLNIGRLQKNQEIPESIKKIHESFKPIEDTSEAYGLSLDDIVIDSKDTIKSILDILFNLYKNPERFEFIDTNIKNTILTTDTPLLVDDYKLSEQVVLDNKNYKIKCFKRDNTALQKKYAKQINFTSSKKHPPHMYIYIAFGDFQGGTNEDGVIIDKKLVTHGPKKLISQTLNITYKYTETKKNDHIINYTKVGSVVGNFIIFGYISSNVELSFKKTKNTTISLVYIHPVYQYKISVETVSCYKKYITSNFNEKECSVNIHYSYEVPIGIGTKVSTGHGQKGIICNIADLSHIKGYTKNGDIVHPLMLLSPTSVLGRTMSNQVMSMFIQPNRAFTKDNILISPHGINIHNIDPSMKTKKSEVKNDLMTTENGFVSNGLSYTMKVLHNQRKIDRNKHQFHFIKQLCALQGVSINLLAFDPGVLFQSLE